MLDVRRLRVLLAVREHGSFAAAAGALSFTPPAVSQHIAALERQLGTALVERHPRNTQLTTHGQRLADHAAEVLARLEEAEADLARSQHTISGLLRIGVIATVGTHILPRTLRSIANLAPHLRMDITQAEPETSIPALQRRDLDVVVASQYPTVPRQTPPQLERHDLLTEPVYVALPTGHPQSGGPDVVPLSSLSDEPWIAPAKGGSCHELLQRSAGLAGFEPTTVAHCGDFDMALALVSAGHGITLVPALAARRLPEGVALVKTTTPEIERSLFALYQHGRTRHPAIQLFLNALAKATPGR